MRRINLSYISLFIIYSCLVLAIGAYFLVLDKLSMRTIKGELPIDFLLRFGTFWFVSFVLALLFFVFHINMNKYYLADSEILRSAKIGKLAFALGAGAAAVALLLYINMV